MQQGFVCRHCTGKIVDTNFVFIPGVGHFHYGCRTYSWQHENASDRKNHIKVLLVEGPSAKRELILIDREKSAKEDHPELEFHNDFLSIEAGKENILKKHRIYDFVFLDAPFDKAKDLEELVTAFAERNKHLKPKAVVFHGSSYNAIDKPVIEKYTQRLISADIHSRAMQLRDVVFSKIREVPTSQVLSEIE